MPIEDYYWIAGGATALLTVACVLLHNEGLSFLSDHLPFPKHYQRRRMATLILSLLALHIVEIWLFGISYYYLLMDPGFGNIQGTGTPRPSLVDSVYYSAAVYTTVGFGDLYPTGAIRVMTGTQGIVGLTLITWSASYTFLEMSKVWNDRN